jgi:hypothetical protein
MEDLWPKIIKATGLVGAGALFFYTIINYVFSDETVALFGNKIIFLLTTALIAVMLIILLVAFLKSEGDSEDANEFNRPK